MSTTTITKLTPWHPTEEEVAHIVAEMRPIVVAFAERSRRQLASFPIDAA